MTENELRILEERRWAALLATDVATLGTLFSDDLIWTHGSGRVDSRQSLLDSLSSGASTYLEVTPVETQFRVVNGVGLVHGKVTFLGRSGGQERVGTNRYLAVWSSGAQPKLVAWQSTSLAGAT